MNGVCTNVIHMHKRGLQYFGVSCSTFRELWDYCWNIPSGSHYIIDCIVQGNYDTYVQTRMELEENQMKKYRWEQDQISHMKVDWRHLV